MANQLNANNVFCLGEWEYFFEVVLPQWINNNDVYVGTIAAEIISCEFIAPLSSFVEKTHKKVPNTALVHACTNLINYLEHDLAARFRNNQTVVLEQIEALKKLVYDFLAIYGSGAFNAIAKNSNAKSKAARAPRIKTPPLNELIRYQEKWIYDNGHTRGWIKGAIYHFRISRSTIQKIMRS